jgi:predicted phosphodiesterase
MPRGSRVLPDACVERLRAADLILHAGDLGSARFLAELEELCPPVLAVHGNMDEPELRAARSSPSSSFSLDTNTRS